MKTILAAACTILASVHLGQGSIVMFDFSGTSPGLNAPWNTGTTIDSNASSTGFTLGSGVGGASGNNRFNANGWSTAATLTSAISDDDYFGFTLALSGGSILNLNSAVAAFTLQVSSTGPRRYALMSSINGFSDGAELLSGALEAGAQTVNLMHTFGASGYDGLSTAVEFRIYGLEAGGAGGTMSVNALSLDGSIVPVPEPAAMGGIAGLGLLLIFAFQTWRERRACLKCA